MVGTVSDISTVSLSISSITTTHQTSSIISIISSTTESSYPSPTLDPVCELPCELSNNSECICPRFPVVVLIIVVIACVAFVLAFLCVFILVVTGILRYFYRTSNKNGDGFSVRFKKKDES
jgi:DMSO reductase anchor subunit